MSCCRRVLLKHHCFQSDRSTSNPAHRFPKSLTQHFGHSSIEPRFRESNNSIIAPFEHSARMTLFFIPKTIVFRNVYRYIKLEDLHKVICC